MDTMTNTRELLTACRTELDRLLADADRKYFIGTIDIAAKMHRPMLEYVREQVTGIDSEFMELDRCQRHYLNDKREVLRLESFRQTFTGELHRIVAILAPECPGVAKLLEATDG